MTFLRLLAIGFRCAAPVQAPGLPDSVSSRRAYDARIPANLLVAANGFYRSQRACDQGSVSALTITCGTTVQEADMESQTTDDEEIFTQLNNTYHSGAYTEIQETSSNLKVSSVSSNKEATTEANKDQDALLQSLEEALRGLK